MGNKNSWWPDVSDLSNAEKAIRYGFWAAVFVASVTGIVALLSLYLQKPIIGIDGAGLVDAVLFAGIAFGIDRRSRTAAIAGLFLYVVERGYTLATASATSSAAVMTVILTLYFLHGVRGTFAYRKLSSRQAMVASVTLGE